MTLRRWIVVGLAAILIFFLVGTCVSKLGESVRLQGDPVGVVSYTIKAFASKDVEKVRANFTPIPGQTMAARTSLMFAKFDKIKVENLHCQESLRELTSARVEAAYDLVVTTFSGQVAVEHYAKTVKLVLIGEKWYINEPF